MLRLLRGVGEENMQAQVPLGRLAVSFRLHLAAEKKAPKTIETYLEAVEQQQRQSRSCAWS
jgi:sulfopyruvate decarboxylase TPP-binding subunit